MAEYSLLITVDPKQVKYLNNWEYQLCFATSCQIDGASPTMTIIAHTTEAKDFIRITWKDEYCMAAGNTDSEVRPETKTLQIKDGQGYLLKDWNHYQVQDDVRAPNDGFHYDTTPSSAPILYQTVQNKVRAVYLGKLLPPNSTESLRPLPNMVGVWFQRDTDNGDKFDPSKQTVAKIVMTTPNMTINYDETWHVKSCPIDYTKGHYAKSLATENGKDGQDGATADSSSADNNSQPQASASN